MCKYFIKLITYKYLNNILNNFFLKKYCLMERIEPIFKEGDYITNRTTGDLAIVKGVTKKGYYQFKAYYGNMFHELKDVKNKYFDLQINYQKFYDLCNEEEKKKLDDIIKKNKE